VISYRTMLSSIAAFALLLSSVLVAVPAAAATTIGDASANQKIDDSSSAVYIVQMVDAPAAAYTGGIPGLRATAPAKGKKLNSLDNDVVKYVDYLGQKHDAKLAKVGAQKTYGYAYSFNGFAAKLTSRQAADLRADPDVVQVEKTQEVMMDTATTVDFLGLKDTTGGLWTLGYKGEDVIIGILDSGIWPESASFSDRTRTNANDKDGKLDYQQIPGWNGKCTPGEQFNASLCNHKLIGATYWCASRGCETGVLPHEFVSARDYNGHGTHTASTAGGNENTATTQGAALFGAVNGVAPRARIAAYKIGWDNGAGGAGANSGDVVAAIDQAISDGVDVLNYSFSGTSSNYLDSVEIAFLFAAQAGVFVATSAGNSGPGASTVAHNSPWLASVAAGTHNRSGTATITLGNGSTYVGASLTDAVPSTSVVLATASGLAGKDANLVRQCFSSSTVTGAGSPQLDPAKVAGKIVVCERGGAAPANARVDKSLAVREAGGVGVILYNVAAGASINADLHSIPTIHVDNVMGAAIVAYVSTVGATASLGRATVNTAAPAPDVAGFSSRGPSIAGGGDILKPDIMAPGQDILAAVAPPGNAGKDFDIYSGTSMSSPHIAGIAALLTQIRPEWSPAAMRSAMATTASTAMATGSSSPFGIGSGQVRPNLSIDPGLVYEAGFDDYRGFLKGQGLCNLCFGAAPATTISASDLNQPSIAFGSLAGARTVRRTLTNVGAAGTYNVTVTAPAGFTVSVSPTSLTFAAGQSKSFDVTVTRTTAALNTYAFGAISWSDGSHTVRSPLVVRPVAISAPATLTVPAAAGTSGSRSFTIGMGYNGPLNYAKHGLVPSTVFSGTVADDPTDNFNTATPTANQGIQTHDITVPAGTSILRVSMFDEDTDGADDIDLYLYRVNADASLTLVGSSGSGTSAEQVQLTNPAAATYRAFVHGWGTDGPDAIYKLHAWSLSSTDAGNVTVTGPSTATIGGTGTVTVAWSGLEAGKRYFGRIQYNDGTTIHATTILRIDP
jgi:subtilisin family serine protease